MKVYNPITKMMEDKSKSMKVKDASSVSEIDKVFNSYKNKCDNILKNTKNLSKENAIKMYKEVKASYSNSINEIQKIAHDVSQAEKRALDQIKKLDEKYSDKLFEIINNK